MEAKKHNTLSLFNGMGCVWLALEEAGHKIGKRYSSEIEKFPNQANDALYPDTEQLGDVRNVDVSSLDYISFLAGGSPCQSFSFAGKRKGMAAKVNTFIPPTEDEYYIYLKDSEFEPDYEDYVEECRVLYEVENSNKELIEILTLEHYLQLKEEGFEFEGQSYLFWEYIRILTDIRKYNPDVKFLLENVIMGKKWQKIITQAIGINPIRVNAALVSAQNRDRLFWTNIYTEQDGFFGDLKCMIPQPKDEGILLKDVLETFETSNYKTEEEFDAYIKKYFLSDKMLAYLNGRKDNFNNGKINYKTEEDVASCLNASTGLDISDNIIVDTNRKARCFTAGGNSGGLHSQMDLIVHNTMPRSSKTGKGGTGHLSWTDGKTYCLDTGNTNAVEIINPLKGQTKFGWHFEQNVYSEESKTRALKSSEGSGNKLKVIIEKQDTVIVAMRGCNPDNPKSRKSGLPTEQQLEPRTDGKTNCLISIQKDNLVIQINPSLESGGKQPFQHNRIYDAEGISPCLNTDARAPIVAFDVVGCDFRTDEGLRIRENGKSGTLAARARNDESCGQLAMINKTIRRLTPRECGRLQSVPEDKLDILLNCGISDTQLYKMFGNGWNIKVISHILKYL